MKKNMISIIFTIIISLIWYYFVLPPLNIHSISFWIWALMSLFVFATIRSIFGNKNIYKTYKLPIESEIVFASIPIIILVIIVINIILSPFFQARAYSKRIEIQENGVFSEDVKPVDFNTLPLLDRDSSMKLGDRVMGQLPELVSQFYVSDYYTQINYNNSIIRVTPLEYNGLFKYINNHNKGVAGYITVDSVSGESKLIKLDNGMKYMPSAIFNEDLYRHLRFCYPTDIFGTENFEIDNSGKPWWVIPVMKYSGVHLKRDVSHVILLDPITGKSTKYKVGDVPTWVDHVYDSQLIIEQVDNWGSYRDGFLNSLFGQKNVVMTTEGYNYTVMNDDVYLYTGITSVSNDEANVGFIMTNLRTKETNYYPVPGAKEYSAMASAEGQVQQMKYNATFPLLVNLNNKPTYVISLKDNAGLVKMYAFVDCVDYQKVVVTDANQGIIKASENYLGDSVTEPSTNDLEKDIIINKITTANIDGTTYYYLVDSENQKYKISIKVNSDVLPFIEKGNTVSIKYKKENEIISITYIELKND